ncbi:hypothetical protein [Roseibium aestuarii]|uniref:Uncharacterized protein n=1 Tax=Roseibium aestuarii TaxID=2600299 RepID=A0ABW4JWQ6_9HYPH|nr:hypothetical protein [Roseibium aestuarii]
MFVALGFCVAVLLGLAIMPAFYKRAVRLTRDAILAVNPASYAEVRAAQDFERAQHALALRKVERALDHEREVATRERAEAGRLRALAETLSRDLEETGNKLKKQKKRKGDDTEAVPDTGTADQTALADLRQRLDETEEALARTQADLDLARLRDGGDDADWKPATDTMTLATITGLESQIATLKGRLAAYEQGQTPDETHSIEDVAELAEARAWASRLEADLVDAEARYISAQAEVTRLAVQLEQSTAPADEQQQTLQRDLKWADNETARLTALVRERERALKRTTSKLQRLRADLKRSPELAGLRADLLALSRGLLEQKTGPQTSSAPEPTPVVEAPVLASASSLLGRIVKASIANAPDQATTASTETAENGAVSDMAASPAAPEKTGGRSKAKSVA